MTRRAAKIDRNQPEIVKALRQAGASVHPCHAAGQGFPDIAVGFRGRNYLLEIKDGNLAPSGRRLTPAQEEWHAAWRGDAVVVTTVSEALAAIGVTSWQGVGDVARRLVENEAARRGATQSGLSNPEIGETGMPLTQHITGKAGGQ